MTGLECLGGFDVFHVYLGALHKEVGNLYGIEEGSVVASWRSTSAAAYNGWTHTR